MERERRRTEIDVKTVLIGGERRIELESENKLSLLITTYWPIPLESSYWSRSQSKNEGTYGEVLAK